MNIRVVIAASLLAMLLGTAPSLAQRSEGQMSLSAAVSLVEGRFNATAVKTDTVQQGDRLVYRIRLLSADKSRVWTVNVDARSGQIN